MFTLSTPTEARWLDLPMGVRVRVRPLDVLVITAARRHAQREVQAIREERRERAEAGVPADDLPDLDDPIVLESIARIEFARGLARYGITAFEGVGNADGTAPLEFSTLHAQGVALHPDMIDSFLASYLAPHEEIALEGNASATMPNGSTGMVAPIAAVATASAPTVPD